MEISPKKSYCRISLRSNINILRRNKKIMEYYSPERPGLEFGGFALFSSGPDSILSGCTGEEGVTGNLPNAHTKPAQF